LMDGRYSVSKDDFNAALSEKVTALLIGHGMRDLSEVQPVLDSIFEKGE